MKLVWIMTEGHEYDIFGELAGSDNLGYAVHRPAVVSYAAGGYVLRQDVLPFYSADLVHEGVHIHVPEHRVVFSVVMDSDQHAKEPIVQEYMAYLNGQAVE